jgi:hypothetical protein
VTGSASVRNTYWYPHAVENAFGIDVDHGVQIKNFADAQSGRYSPPKFIGSTHAYAVALHSGALPILHGFTRLSG